MRQHIPKKLYYVWDGHLPDKVAHCIASWVQVMPDYEIIELNNNSSCFDLEQELGRSSWFRTAFQRKMWAFVADYIRVKALYDHGGIYLDTDITTLRPFDDLLNHSFFAGFESSTKVNVSVFGCVAGHPLLKDLYEFYQKAIWHSNLFTIPDIITYLLTGKYKCILYDSRKYPCAVEIDTITLYPEKSFYPYRYDEVYTDTCLSTDTYTIHWWNASWVKPEILDWLFTKHLPQVAGGDTSDIDMNVMLKDTPKELKLQVLLFNKFCVLKAYKQGYCVCIEILGLSLISRAKKKGKTFFFLFNRFLILSLKQKVR